MHFLKSIKVSKSLDLNFEIAESSIIAWVEFLYRLKSLLSLVFSES